MKYKCALFVVNDVRESRKFYEEILDQVVKYDFGENITFEGDFAIQEKISFSNMASVDVDSMVRKSNNTEIYFEADDIDHYVNRIVESTYEIEFIHKIVEHPWGQRVIRFYDLDDHIVEIGESMERVIFRFLDKGYSIEETAKTSQHPESFVRECVERRSTYGEE